MKTNTYVENESYKHKLAKDLLYEWFVHEQNSKDSCGISPIGWEKNYGVFKELKFHDTDDPYYFENSLGLIYDGRTTPWPTSNNDWFDPNYKRGKILFVPDITIFHKGTARIIVEIAHKHYLDDNKINAIAYFFKGFGISIYEIEAEALLRLTSKPSYLPIYRYLEL